MSETLNYYKKLIIVFFNSNSISKFFERIHEYFSMKKSKSFYN